MNQPTETLEAANFEEIETAVRQTDRGRWFLDEFARRRRAEDTMRILAAIDRLETRSAEAAAAETRARLELERSATVLRELANLLRELRPARDGRAPLQPDRIAAGAGGDLEARLAALASLDAPEVEKKLKLFG